MHLEWSLAAHDGVCLVALQVTNTGPERRVRVDNNLDGPVWFPRRQGRPAAGWDEDGFEGRLAAGETRPLGYACPAEPRDPPAEVADVEGGTAREDDPTATDVLQDLGDPRPPRDAVPTPEHPQRPGTRAGGSSDWRERWR